MKLATTTGDFAMYLDSQEEAILMIALRNKRGLEDFLQVLKFCIMNS